MINANGFDGEPTELSRDMLPMKGYQIYNCNDYKLGKHDFDYRVCLKYSLIKQLPSCYISIIIIFLAVVLLHMYCAYIVHRI